MGARTGERSPRVTEALLGPSSQIIVNADDAPRQIGEVAARRLSQLYRDMEFGNTSEPQAATARLGVFTFFSYMLEGFVSHEIAIECGGEIYNAWSERRDCIAGEGRTDSIHKICLNADAFCEGLYRMSSTSPNAKRLYEDLKVLCLTLISLHQKKGAQTDEFEAAARALRTITSELSR